MKKPYQLIFAVAIILFSSNSFADECDGVDHVLKQGKYNSALLIVDPLLKQGVTCAQYYKGLMYLRGQGVTRDFEKGVALIKSAEKKGYPAAIEFMESFY